jgi:hypothetical protein
MMKVNDSLYYHFNAHLLHLDIEKESHSDFITSVVESYMKEIQTRGYLSAEHEFDLREDIELEVVIMLRKTIYGHFNLDHYRKNSRDLKKPL